jgi:capsular polysaccharide biosynthesis protein
MSTQTIARPYEISDWFHALGRRLALILIIPLVAGALAGALAIRQPHQYRTSTTVVIAHPQTFGPASAAVSQSVDDFQGVLNSNSVATLTSQQTGAPLKNVSSGLSSQRRGSSSAVDVTYVGTSSTVAPKVVVAASHNALGALAQANLTLASSELDAAKKDYNDALDQLTAFSAASYIVDFPAAIGAYERRLRDARDALSTAIASGNQKAVNAAKSKLVALTSVAVKLKAGYQGVADHLDAAKATYTSAQSATIQAEGEVAAAQVVQLTASPVVALSRITHVIKRVIPAMVFGLVLAVGLVVLLELLRPRSAHY